MAMTVEEKTKDKKLFFSPIEAGIVMGMCVGALYGGLFAVLLLLSFGSNSTPVLIILWLNGLLGFLGIRHMKKHTEYFGDWK